MFKFINVKLLKAHLEKKPSKYSEFIFQPKSALK